MAAGSRDWESWVQPEDEFFSAAGSVRGDDDDDIDLDNIDAETASECFEELLVSLKFSGHLQANHVCTLAFWALKADMKPTEVLSKLATKPNAQTGAFSRKFDKTLGTAPKDAQLYHVDVPSKNRSSASRVVSKIPVLPMHEALCSEYVESAGLDTDLRQAVADGELPQIYWDHPVVRSAINVLVHPVCIFVDGVSFGRQGWDNCIAWWAYFMFSKTRHLIAVLRKSELCSCGCRGWCSIQPIWESIKWGNDHKNQRS
jgi:hypothetical protein